jgi:transmembrane sensor
MIGSMFKPRRPKTAAEWFAALRGGASPTIERQFQRWLAENPMHGEEYALCEILWEVSGPAAADVPRPPPARRVDTRAIWGGALVAAAASLVIALWFWPHRAQIWSTGPGEQRALLLEDGSRVTLNTRTRIEVEYARGQREVTLLGGEAYFDVAKDPGRPFRVRTQLGSARAVGTHFNVYYVDGLLAVTTAEGVVAVSGAAGGSRVMVAAGNRAELGAGTPKPTVSRADVGRELNWLSQRIEVDNVPLESLLRDFSRYTSMRLEAGSPEVGSLRVSAVLRTGDLEALRATLKGALDLELESRRGEILVVPANSHPGKGNSDATTRF